MALRAAGPTGAPRLALRLWHRPARGALRAVALVAGMFGALLAVPADAEIVAAQYEGPTTRYPHGVLGDTVEHDTLRVTLKDGRSITARYPDTIVFEDTAPRLVDVDGDGAMEVIVVESHEQLGARLAIWAVDDGALILRAATPHIGTRFRWLAPAGVGAADLDGDGRIEIAFVDRPHLARTLRIWRYTEGALTQVAALPGVTNHRIGEVDIAGGIRTCAGVPEILVADSNWRNVLAVRFDGTDLSARTDRPHTGRDSFAAAMACE